MLLPFYLPINMVIIGLIISFALLLIAMTVHEFAHGWVAYKRGDLTAKYSGRLTLNPLAHIDPVGTVILPLLLYLSTNGRFVFGAAKPVPIDFRALKNPKQDMIWIGLAGPAANLILALLCSFIYRFVAISELLRFILENLIVINVVLALFNLIPIPPLDGSRVVLGLLPSKLAYRYAMIEPFGFYILIALIFLRVLDNFLWPIAGIILRNLGVNF